MKMKLTRKTVLDRSKLEDIRRNGRGRGRDRNLGLLLDD